MMGREFCQRLLTQAACTVIPAEAAIQDFHSRESRTNPGFRQGDDQAYRVTMGFSLIQKHSADVPAYRHSTSLPPCMRIAIIHLWNGSHGILKTPREEYNSIVRSHFSVRRRVIFSNAGGRAPEETNLAHLTAHRYWELGHGYCS